VDQERQADHVLDHRPDPLLDYYTDDQLIASQLNKLGFNVKVDGNGSPTAAGRLQTTAISTHDPLEQPGPNPFYYYENWIDSTFSAPIGKRPPVTTAGSITSSQARWPSSPDQRPATQKAAIVSLQKIMSTQVPMTPLLYRRAWSEISTRNYTGWPTNGNAYMTPIRTAHT
jgi:peptide/nickel transport system substrate-binding protein